MTIKVDTIGSTIDKLVMARLRAPFRCEFIRGGSGMGEHASRWRNTRQPQVITALRELGHDVYDFRNPEPGDHGFSWRSCAPDEYLRNPRRFRDDVLTHSIAREGFRKDMTALRRANATVLVLPCGRSAHLELGYAIGYDQLTFVLLDDPLSEPELMYLMVGTICVTLEELLEEFKP